MSLLDNHLEQISLSAATISELPFPPPKVFTNALLRSHDITILIRDTEAHERALFSTDPNAQTSRTSCRTTRRATAFAADGLGGSMVNKIHAARDPRKQSAVARVLGGDVLDEIKRSSGGAGGGRSGGAKGEINVEVLLRGAEKLCSAYPIAGAPEKIAALRNRHQQVSEGVAHYEAVVVKQAAQLERMNRSQDFGSEPEDEEHATDDNPDSNADGIQITEEDIQRELEEIRELESKKRILEERVTGMEKDLGGLLR